MLEQPGVTSHAMMGNAMATLYIHLQEGFTGEEVIIRVDGEERLHFGEVRTRRIVGRARRDALEVADGQHVFEICVPARGIEKRLEAAVRGELHVGIGLGTGDEPRVRVSETSFGYA